MSLLGPRSGSWYVNSKIDPRWNGNGDSDSVGGFSIPTKAQAHIDAKKKELGDLPEDLEWGYMKD